MRVILASLCVENIIGYIAFGSRCGRMVSRFPSRILLVTHKQYNLFVYLYTIGSRFSTCILLEHSFPFHFSLFCSFMYDYLSIRYLFVLEFWCWCGWVLMPPFLTTNVINALEQVQMPLLTSMLEKVLSSYIYAFSLLIKNKNKICFLKSKCPLIKSTLVLYSNWLITIWPYNQANLKIS